MKRRVFGLRAVYRLAAVAAVGAVAKAMAGRFAIAPEPGNAALFTFGLVVTVITMKRRRSVVVVAA